MRREIASASQNHLCPPLVGACLIAFALLAGIEAAQAPARAAQFDLIVRHGRLIDGTGSPAQFADVAIQDGRIAAVGRIAAPAAAELDARGHIVAPGFIDVHTHAEDIADLPLAENFVRMGVTTLVLGNCGSSVRDVAELWQRIQTAGVSANIATLAGHNTVRSAVMGGSFMRPPTDGELSQMRGLVRRAMEDGAVGLSTGLIYLPGTFAKTGEIVELAKEASVFGGIYVSHMRDEGLGIFGALEELTQIAREAKVRAHVSHIKLSNPAAWGQAGEVLKFIERARDAGLDITHDQYVYTASSTGISQLIPASAREGGREKFVERVGDSNRKSELMDEMKRRLREARRTSYEYAVIAHYKEDPSLNGKSVFEAAKLRRGSGSLEAQIETILEIHTKGGASAVFHSMNEEDLRTFLSHPNTMIAADSGVRRFQEGVPHPRGYGNNARVLARYVRELGLLRIEEAIRRMTSLPAGTFRLKDRGLLREGSWADLVIFDPSTVQDEATFNEPHQYPTGIRDVFVNGVAVVRDGVHTGAKPGRPVRRMEAE